MKKYSTFASQLGESALDLTDKAKLSLYKKSQNSGISTDILEEVYRRGYRCWTEAFGGTPEQFAFDRVNSFIADGFAAQLDEDLKKACWKGYEAIGMKKKNGKTVPNCVPVKEAELNAPLPPIETIAKKFDKPVDVIKRAVKSGSKVEKEHTKEQKTAEKIATAHVNERPDYYKKLNKAGLEEQEEARSKDSSKPCSRFIGSDELVTIYKSQTPGQIVKQVVREHINEVAMAMPPAVQPPAVVGQQVPGVKRQAPRPTQVSGRAGGRMAGQSGTMSARPNVKVSSGVQPSIERSWTRSGTARMGSGGGSMSASPTKVGSSFSQGGVNVGKGMAASKQTSPVVKGMTTAGRDAAAVVSKAAPTVAKGLGTAAKIAGGPVVGGVMAAMEPTPAGEKMSEFERQDVMKKYNPFKSQGRSISQYEKDVLTPKSSETPKPPAPKVDAPTPPSRPEYFSRGQAFQAARAEKGGAGGQFSYGGKEYQTNVAGEKYVSKPTTTSVKDEFESGGAKKKIKEAIAEATYKGKKVTLNKPMKGDVKKSKVFVDPDGDGKAQKVNFGDKKLSIKKHIPDRKKSYCARSSGQGNLTDKTSANYWSRKAWNCEGTEE